MKKTSDIYFGFSIHFAISTIFLLIAYFVVLPKLTEYPTITEIYRVLISIMIPLCAFFSVHAYKRGVARRKQGL